MSTENPRETLLSSITTSDHEYSLTRTPSVASSDQEEGNWSDNNIYSNSDHESDEEYDSSPSSSV